MTPDDEKRWRWNEPLTDEQRLALLEQMRAEWPSPLELPSSRELVDALRAAASEPFQALGLAESPLLPPERARSTGAFYGGAEMIRDVEEIAIVHGVDPPAFWNSTHAEMALVVRTRALAEAQKLVAAAVLTARLPALATTGRAALDAGDPEPPSVSELKLFLATDGVRGMTRAMQLRACRSHFTPRPVPDRLFRRAKPDSRKSGRRRKG